MIVFIFFIQYSTDRTAPKLSLYLLAEDFISWFLRYTALGLKEDHGEVAFLQISGHLVFKSKYK